jgi:5-methylthioadenosine/S-adenosylhomocysteine deaminase
LDGQIGELKVGLQADFAVVALDGPHQIPSYDLVSTLIFASSGRDVRLTVVAGREIYSDGHVTTVDEDRLRARMKEIAEKLAS